MTDALTWVMTILCLGCGEPAQRQEYPSLKSCQTAIAEGRFIAGSGVAVVAICGQERKA